MHTGKGLVKELILRDGHRHARIACPLNLIPSPGQYLLTGAASDSPLPDPVYYTESAPEGFLASPAPDLWIPGMDLHLRGPLGRGFDLPASARKIALIDFGGSISRLRPLIKQALNQRAAVVLFTDLPADSLPDELEVQPLSAVSEIAQWADWMAFEALRENLHEVRERLGAQHQLPALQDAEILIRTPIPCGGAADCGVCAVTTKSGWRLACRDGPVFRWSEV
ncbi:MAG TPA: hypothetical protein VMJ90_09485 [Anaerolineales bacterium]|nr:hypothetical protein [Anaerolineales bacterium]